MNHSNAAEGTGLNALNYEGSELSHAVLVKARSVLGGSFRVKALTVLAGGKEKMTAALWAERILAEYGGVDAAGRELARRYQAYELSAEAAPETVLSRAEKCAIQAAKPKGLSVVEQALQASDMVAKGVRVHAVVPGAEKASPVRDPRTGKVDVLATMAKLGLGVAARDADDERMAHWDAADLAGKVAFGQVA